MAQQPEKSALRAAFDVLVALVFAAAIFTIAFADWAQPIRSSITRHAQLHFLLDYFAHHKPPRVPPSSSRAQGAVAPRVRLLFPDSIPYVAGGLNPAPMRPAFSWIPLNSAGVQARTVSSFANAPLAAAASILQCASRCTSEPPRHASVFRIIGNLFYFQRADFLS
jgi:hypothetical protein